MRYSSDNSNSRSLAQQLQLELARARARSHFIPWQYLFADAAVTGTTSHRRGYQELKSLIRSDAPGLTAVYIDEVGRASRDAVETLQLGRLIDARRRRLIGVSDGFDSTSEMSKMMLTVAGMFHEHFIDQLRAKVKRGMNDAFRLGTNLGKPALGYTLEPAFYVGVRNSRDTREEFGGEARRAG